MATGTNVLIDADGLQTALENVNDSFTRIKDFGGVTDLPTPTKARQNRIIVTDLIGAGTTASEYAAYIVVQTADGYAWMELNRKPDLSAYVTQTAMAEALHNFGKSYVTTTALNTALADYATIEYVGNAIDDALGDISAALDTINGE